MGSRSRSRWTRVACGERPSPKSAGSVCRPHSRRKCPVGVTLWTRSATDRPCLHSAVEPLFAEKDRSDPAIKRASESTYRFLDRVDDPVFARVRDLFSAWLDRYRATQSPEACRDLVGRLKSKQDPQCYAAFWELYLHELHARLGFAIEAHPESETDARPDFVLERGGTRFYLEAVMPSPAIGSTGLSPNAQTVIEQVQRARSDDFMLSLKFVVGGPDTPRTRSTVARIERWLEALHWDDWAQGGIQANDYPEAQLRVGDWTIGVQARPRSPELRGNRDFPTVVSFPPSSGFPDAMADALVPTLAEKAAKYGDPDAPYVIAVYVMSAMSSSGTAGRALFGSEVPLEVGRHPTGFAGSRIERRGLWTPNASSRGRVSALLAAPSFDFNYSAVARVLPRCWRNPWAMRPLEAGLPFASSTVSADEATVENRAAAVAPHELFELPEDWPGQPFQARRK
jgi:hypothetical protein